MGKIMAFWLVKFTVLVLSLLFWRSYPYLTAISSDKCHRAPLAHRTVLQLHKLELELPPYQVRPLAAKDWDFHLLETRDLAEASELALECFYSPRLTLNLDGMSEAEKWVWGGVINFYTAVDKSDTRNGNYLGMRSRSGGRLSSPTLSLSTDSFILVATPVTNLSDRSKPEIAAIVEICVEQPGGKLAPPVANPFRSKVAKDSEQPYLCNLCVGKAYRRRGLGKLICELSEELVQMHWNKDMMYLHVEQSNRAAQALYLGMGYQLVSPGLSAWEKKMEGMENILYYSNRLRRQWVDPALVVEGFQDRIKLSSSSSDSSDRDSSVLLGMSDLDMKIASNIMRSKA
jgi:hypothetical protein